MTRHSLICLLALFLVQASHADSLKDALNHKYKHQILALRFPFTGADQTFDSAGHPLNTPPTSGWLLYGGIYVEKLSLSSDTLRLEGPRAAPTTEKKNGRPMLVRFSKLQQIEIHLDQPLKSLDDVDAVMARVFFPSADSAVRAWPEFRRADDTPDDQVYHVGNGTSPPRPTYTPEPEFSEEARRARFQGTVVMTVVVSKTGHIVRIKLQKALGKGLDENAMEELKSWRFEPASYKGQPVAVEMNIEVAFHLYSNPRTLH